MKPQMDFSDALILIKSGVLMTRKAWESASYLALNSDKTAILEADFDCSSTWEPLHDDLLADDWERFA